MTTVPEESLKRWTSDEVQRIVASGGIEHPKRLELIEGLILERQNRSRLHVASVMRSQAAFEEAFGTIRIVTSGISLALSETSEPMPDMLVVSRAFRRNPTKEHVLLVVEVADTSLKVDQTVKAALYARHGIPEYVILDVINRRAEIRRRPKGEEWGETVVLTEDGEFTPLGASSPIRVADLLADKE